MDNHYHFVVETAEGNLSKGMRQMNGVYTQYFNRQYNRVGHVFQGRYKAILVKKETYLLELSRYVVLNPVRAKMLDQAEDWPWSSYQAMLDKVEPYPWLEINWILGQFSDDRLKAIERYINFVREGVGLPPVWTDLKQQIYIGSDQFIESMLKKVGQDEKGVEDVPLMQRRMVPKTLEEYREQSNSRNESIRVAFSSGGYTMKQIGSYFGLHYTSVSRIINSIK